MLGFRSKTSWKTMIAVLYYALSFLGFAGGVYIGIAILAVAWSAPNICLALFEALFHGRKEQFYAIPVFVAVLGVSAVMLAVDYDLKIKSATAEIAVAELSEDNELTKTKVYITSSGSKYHREGCRFIEDRQTIPVTIDEASDRGLSPCSVCSE